MTNPETVASTQVTEVRRRLSGLEFFQQMMAGVLPPLGFEVPRRHKKFKSHRARFYFDADPVTTDLARPTFSCLS